MKSLTNECCTKVFSRLLPKPKNQEQEVSCHVILRGLVQRPGVKVLGLSLGTIFSV